MYRLKRILYFLMIFWSLPAIAQPPVNTEVSFDSLSLEDLMNIKITVASIKELTPRQSPGIITYITAEDIRNQGARDLMEVLRNVPGFEFGLDVEGVVGLGIRGNWAHEGKVVLFIDGQEMNESLYSTLQFGNHYPVEHIDRIEIIRGPGSALHGGFAAYAVINIITRTPKSGTEAGATVYQGTTAEQLSRSNLSAYLGHKGKSSSFSVKINASETQRSHRRYSDIFGDGYDMQNQSGIRNIFLNAGGNIGNLHLRLISDNYTLQTRDEYVEIADAASYMQFVNNIFEVKYNWKPNDKWKVVPSLRISNETPWSTPRKYLETDNEPFRINTMVYTATINSSYDLNSRLNFSGGISLDRDDSKILIENEVFNTTGTNTFVNENINVYAQSLYAASWANIVAGFRFNYNERYNNSLVPRIGLTKEFKRFHLKALYSRAFRAPSTQNINLSDKIQPESTDVFEVEGGFKVSGDAYLTLNLYHVNTHDPIIYFVDTITNTDAYTNVSRTGTYGMEIVFQWKKKWGGVDFNTSYYLANDQRDFTFYNIPDDDNAHLGLAQCKSNLAFRYMLTSNVQFGSNLTWIGSRYGISKLDETTGVQIYEKYDPFLLLNAHLEYRFKKVKGLSMRFSVRNILDQEELFIQPYNSDHAPLPGMGREFQLRISYQNF
jgi:outer membrane receptor for ferrienterochelin and colicin